MVISSFLFGTALVWHTGRKQNVERISFFLLFALAHVMMWLKFNDKLQFVALMREMQNSECRMQNKCISYGNDYNSRRSPAPAGAFRSATAEGGS